MPSNLTFKNDEEDFLADEENSDFFKDEEFDESKYTSDTIQLRPDIQAELDVVLSKKKEQQGDTQKSNIPAFPCTAASQQRNESLMNEVLSNKEPDERANILRVAYQAGVERDDPLFAVLLATGQLELLLNKKPNEIEQLFDHWKQQWQEQLKQAGEILAQEREQFRLLIDDTQETLELQSRAALDVQKRNISKSVAHLVRIAAFKKVAHDAYALIAAGVILLSAVSMGLVLGLAVPLFAKSPELDPTGPRQLTVEEAKALDWGLSELGRFAQENPDLIRWLQSEEGQYARKFMQWNQTLLSGKAKRVCELDIDQLGVTLTLEGRVATSGFCTLWTQPPEKRKFVR